MGTQIGGKQWATRITTVVAAGSMTAAGIAVLAVEPTIPVHASTTSNTSPDPGTSPSQVSVPTQPQDNGYSPDGNAVQPGNGGAINAHSSGS